MSRWRYLVNLGVAFALFIAPGREILFGTDSTAAQTTMQNPTGAWWAFGSGRVQCGQLLGANFNVTTDQKITVSVPTTNFMLDSIVVSNASVSLTTAQGGVYTAASKGGTAVVAATQAYTTLTAAAAGASGSAMTMTLATAGSNNMLVAPTFSPAGGSAAVIGNGILYFALTTAQGAAATADIRVYCRPMY